MSGVVSVDYRLRILIAGHLQSTSAGSNHCFKRKLLSLKHDRRLGKDAESEMSRLRK